MEIVLIIYDVLVYHVFVECQPVKDKESTIDFTEEDLTEND